MRFLSNSRVRIPLPKNIIISYHLSHDTSTVTFYDLEESGIKKTIEEIGKAFPTIEVEFEPGCIRIYWKGRIEKFLTKPLPTKAGDRYIVDQIPLEVEEFQVHDEDGSLLSSDNLEDLDYPLGMVYVVDKQNKLTVPVLETEIFHNRKTSLYNEVFI